MCLPTVLGSPLWAEEPGQTACVTLGKSLHLSRPRQLVCSLVICIPGPVWVMYVNTLCQGSSTALVSEVISLNLPWAHSLKTRLAQSFFFRHQLPNGNSSLGSRGGLQEGLASFAEL